MPQFNDDGGRDLKDNHSGQQVAEDFVALLQQMEKEDSEYGDAARSRKRNRGSGTTSGSHGTGD